jgi:hypothetical protein
MEIGSVTALKYYVKSGLGIALVPKVVLTADPSLRGTTTREFSNPITMTSGIVCKTTEYPLKFANLKVYQYLKQRFGAK